MVRSILAKRENVLQIGLQESSISKVGHFGIGNCGDFVVDVNVFFAKIIEHEPSKIGGIRNVSDLFYLLWQREVDQISNPGEPDVVEALLQSHCPESLPVGPCVPI